jgi:sterol desaturase/sphingolipid hydroxylase (fatty acid hydroxylase superfamily)
LLHRRFFFRHIHRVHHRWTSPTAFTAPAMHPLEFALYQSIMLAPLFFLPIHVVGLVAVLVYQNTIAFLDHSGVALGSVLPFQPPPRFHDDHHVYFHVNYGQTLGLWDRIFGTWRRAKKEYGADVFTEDQDRKGELVDYRNARSVMPASREEWGSERSEDRGSSHDAAAEPRSGEPAGMEQQ